MTTAFKKAFTEWFDNLFIFEFGLNLFLTLLFFAATFCEVAYLFYASSIENAIFNPFVAFMLIPLGIYSYQIGELVVKYSNK